MSSRPIPDAIYVSRRTGERFIIESVSEPEDDGFFLVCLGPADDLSAMGYELTNEEWSDMCRSMDFVPE